MLIYGGPSYECKQENCWAEWDLTGSAINAAGQVWNDIPWGWRWYGQQQGDRLALGDYDGDGKTDRVIVHSDSSNSHWYGISSSGTELFPWGWEWSGMTTAYRLALGDYDGDGETDRVIVGSDGTNSYWYGIFSDPNSKDPFEWGWKWAGMSAGDKLALGDYDGDGKTDRVIVHQTTTDSYWYGIFSDPNSEDPFEWGW